MNYERSMEMSQNFLNFNTIRILYLSLANGDALRTAEDNLPEPETSFTVTLL
jgi:hypothetical protein